MGTCWPLPLPPRSPSRRLRPSRPSLPIPAPSPRSPRLLQLLLPLPPRLLLLLLPRRRARRKMMTWASASSTKLCRPCDDCRKHCQLPVHHLLLSCWVFLFQIWKLFFQLVGFAE